MLKMTFALGLDTAEEHRLLDQRPLYKQKGRPRNRDSLYIQYRQNYR
jgi:hypothetical protein